MKPVEEVVEDAFEDYSEGSSIDRTDLLTQDRKNIKDSLVEGLEGMKMSKDGFEDSVYGSYPEFCSARNQNNLILQDAIDYIINELS